MSWLLRSLAFAFALLLGACAAAPGPAHLLPATQPADAACVDPSARYVLSSESAQRSVIVLPGDGNADAVRRELSLVDRVGRALVDELAVPGLRIFDQGGLTSVPPASRRWRDTELVEAARNDVREPVDRLVVFSVFVDNFPEAGRFHARVRVAARLYALPDGNLLGGDYEAVETVVLPVPSSCDTACFTGLLGDAARPLGTAVGRKLRRGVAAMGRSYPVELFGFSSAEVQRVDDELRAFPGYRSHRVEEDSGDFVRMRYASTLLATDLGHNLRTLMQCLDVPARVEFSRDRFAVRRRDR